MENSPDQKGLLPDWKPDGETAAPKAPVQPPPPPVPPVDHSHTSGNTGMAKSPHTSNPISSAMLGGVGMKR